MVENVLNFHKMKTSLDKNKHVSLFHTNICSLQANFDNLELLLHDLDHNFDIIALTETWNPENKKHLFSPKNIENYHDYIGVTGTTSKSGAGLYIHKDLKPLPRPDLDFKIFKDKQEGESCWVEIINDKSPNIIVGVIYRHPSETDNIFIENLKKNSK